MMQIETQPNRTLVAFCSFLACGPRRSAAAQRYALNLSAAYLADGAQAAVTDLPAAHPALLVWNWDVRFVEVVYHCAGEYFRTLVPVEPLPDARVASNNLERLKDMFVARKHDLSWKLTELTDTSAESEAGNMTEAEKSPSWNRAQARLARLPQPLPRALRLTHYFSIPALPKTGNQMKLVAIPFFGNPPESQALNVWTSVSVDWLRFEEQVNAKPRWERGLTAPSGTSLPSAGVSAVTFVVKPIDATAVSPNSLPATRPARAPMGIDGDTYWVRAMPAAGWYARLNARLETACDPLAAFASLDPRTPAPTALHQSLRDRAIAGIAFYPALGDPKTVVALQKLGEANGLGPAFDASVFAQVSKLCNSVEPITREMNLNLVLWLAITDKSAESRPTDQPVSEEDAGIPKVPEERIPPGDPDEAKKRAAAELKVARTIGDALLRKAAADSVARSRIFFKTIDVALTRSDDAGPRQAWGKALQNKTTAENLRAAFGLSAAPRDATADLDEEPGPDLVQEPTLATTGRRAERMAMLRNLLLTDLTKASDAQDERLSEEVVHGRFVDFVAKEIDDPSELARARELSFGVTLARLDQSQMDSVRCLADEVWRRDGDTGGVAPAGIAIQLGALKETAIMTRAQDQDFAQNFVGYGLLIRRDRDQAWSLASAGTLHFSAIVTINARYWQESDTIIAQIAIAREAPDGRYDIMIEGTQLRGVLELSGAADVPKLKGVAPDDQNELNLLLAGAERCEPSESDPTRVRFTVFLRAAQNRFKSLLSGVSVSGSNSEGPLLALHCSRLSEDPVILPMAIADDDQIRVPIVHYNQANPAATDLISETLRHFHNTRAVGATGDELSALFFGLPLVFDTPPRQRKCLRQRRLAFQQQNEPNFAVAAFAVDIAGGVPELLQEIPGQLRDDLDNQLRVAQPVTARYSPPQPASIESRRETAIGKARVVFTTTDGKTVDPRTNRVPRPWSPGDSDVLPLALELHEARTATASASAADSTKRPPLPPLFLMHEDRKVADFVARPPAAPIDVIMRWWKTSTWSNVAAQYFAGLARTAILREASGSDDADQADLSLDDPAIIALQFAVDGWDWELGDWRELVQLICPVDRRDGPYALEDLQFSFPIKVVIPKGLLNRPELSVSEIGPRRTSIALSLPGPAEGGQVFCLRIAPLAHQSDLNRFVERSRPNRPASTAPSDPVDPKKLEFQGKACFRLPASELLFEVASAEMPAPETVYKSLAVYVGQAPDGVVCKGVRDIQLSRQRDIGIALMFGPGRPLSTSWRNVGRVEVLRQNWTWRGRPLESPPFAHSAWPLAAQIQRFDESASLLRWEVSSMSDTDPLLDTTVFPSIDAQGLPLIHPEARRSTFGVEVWRDDQNAVLQAGYYRYGIRLVSRYESIYRGQARMIVRAEDPHYRGAGWRRAFLPYDGHAPLKPNVQSIIPLITDQIDPRHGLRFAPIVLTQRSERHTGAAQRSLLPVVEWLQERPGESRVRSAFREFLMHDPALAHRAGRVYSLASDSSANALRLVESEVAALLNEALFSPEFHAIRHGRSAETLRDTVSIAQATEARAEFEKEIPGWPAARIDSSGNVAGLLVVVPDDPVSVCGLGEHLCYEIESVFAPDSDDREPWYEIAPDPILSAATYANQAPAASQPSGDAARPPSLIPVTVPSIGPIGLTEDIEARTPRFTNAMYFFSPPRLMDMSGALSHIDGWAMARIRLRRLSGNTDIDIWPPPGTLGPGQSEQEQRRRLDDAKEKFWTKPQWVQFFPSHTFGIDFGSDQAQDKTEILLRLEESTSNPRGYLSVLQIPFAEGPLSLWSPPRRDLPRELPGRADAFEYWLLVSQDVVGFDARPAGDCYRQILPICDIEPAGKRWELRVRSAEGVVELGRGPACGRILEVQVAPNAESINTGSKLLDDLIPRTRLDSERGDLYRRITRMSPRFRFRTAEMALPSTCGRCQSALTKGLYCHVCGAACARLREADAAGR